MKHAVPLIVALAAGGYCAPASAQDETDGAVSSDSPGPSPSLAEAAGSPTADPQDDGLVAGPVAGPTEPPPDGPLPWRNTILLWDNALNTTAFGEADLSHNPTFIMTWSLRPRWYVTDTAFIGLRQNLSLELTDTDCGALYSSCRARNREPVLGDLRFSFFENKVVGLGGLTLAAGANVDLPLSIASRNRDMYFAVGPVARATYVVREVMSGLIFQAIGSYAYTVGGTNRRGDPADYLQATALQVQSDQATIGATGDGFAIGGPSAANHAGNLTLLGVLNATPELNVILSFSWLWRMANPENAPDGGWRLDGDQVISGPEPHVAPERASQARLFTVFGASVGYNVTGWMNLALNYQNLTSEFEGDDTTGEAIRSNPFWSHNSTVSLTATVTLDQLYQSIVQGDSEGNPLQNMVAQGPQTIGRQ